MKITTEMYVKKAKEVHGDKYTYDNCVYVNSNTNVTVTCPVHGDFEIRPSNHTVLKRGCNKGCAKIAADYTRTSLEDFLNKARLKHGDKFDYSLVDYKSQAIKIKIICPIHGVFEQLPSNHYKYDCRRCSRKVVAEALKNRENIFSRSGFKTRANGRMCKFYLIKCWNSEEVFYKIGITTQSVSRRYHTIKSMPYLYEIVKEINGEAEQIWNIESKLKKNLTSCYTPLIPFAGSKTECYSDLNEILDNI